MAKSQLITPDHTPERAKFPVIDAHNHLWGALDKIPHIRQVMEDVGVWAYCDLTADVALSLGGGGYVLEPANFSDFQEAVARNAPGWFYGFTTAGIMRPPDRPLFDKAEEFVAQACEILARDVRNGALGLKLTKELGLCYRDAAGHLIDCDDPRLRPLWQEAARLKVPVLIHQADPIAFFEPLTPDNEHYDTLQEFSAWHFADRAKYPAFATLQQRYRNLIAQNPETTFFLPHCANWPENLSYVSELLDSYPNVYMDFSARVDELGRQPYRAREWMIRYQDRLFFGTDMPASAPMYRFHFRFLETWDEDFAPPFYDGTFGRHRWKVHGLGLPDSVLRKLYSENILRFLPGLRDRLRPFTA